eukprot:4586010-Pleurochrysis_carterae.AAC.2
MSWATFWRSSGSSDIESADDETGGAEYAKSGGEVAAAVFMSGTAVHPNSLRSYKELLLHRLLGSFKVAAEDPATIIATDTAIVDAVLAFVAAVVATVAVAVVGAAAFIERRRRFATRAELTNERVVRHAVEPRAQASGDGGVGCWCGIGGGAGGGGGGEGGGSVGVSARRHACTLVLSTSACVRSFKRVHKHRKRFLQKGEELTLAPIRQSLKQSAHAAPHETLRHCAPRACAPALVLAASPASSPASSPTNSPANFSASVHAFRFPNLPIGNRVGKVAIVQTTSHFVLLAIDANTHICGGSRPGLRANVPADMAPHVRKDGVI